MANKHIHFIGICGVAMSALAIAFHKKGYKVTGSDKGFYPPVSDYLKKAGIEYYPGWHVDKMTTDGDPDLVVVGNVAGSKNPEWVYVQKHKLEYKSYPEAVAEYFVKEKSIVAAGTYGKSTSASIITWVTRQAGLDPAYMFGGIPLNDMSSAELTDSDISILEGDEYKSSRWDRGPKFAHYSPTHLLLTSVNWDHADVYPTEESYFDVFRKLTTSIPEKGLIVASEKVDTKIVELSNCPVVTYGAGEENDYIYSDVKTTKEGIVFKITHKSTVFVLHSPVLGDYMADNMTGCFAMCHQMDIEPRKIIEAISTFKNIKRRLERRVSRSINVFDDIAHSPKKAEAVLTSLKSVFDGKLIAVFEPNTGNRQEESIPGYEDAFKNADTVIIPRLTKIKQDPTKPKALNGPELARIIGKSHNNVMCIEDDGKLIDTLLSEAKEGDVIVFLGSHGFRGMIESLVEKIR